MLPEVGLELELGAALALLTPLVPDGAAFDPDPEGEVLTVATGNFLTETQSAAEFLAWASGSYAR